MASGAGQNYGRAVLLDNVTTTISAVTVANGTTQAYGLLGENDSGGLMFSLRGYTKWRFQIVQIGSTPITGFEFSVFQTISPNGYLTWEAANTYGVAPKTWVAAVSQPAPPVPGLPGNVILPQAVAYPGVTNATGFVPGIAPWEWQLAEGPSEQSTTGGIANPLTTATPQFTISGVIDGVRAVLSSQGTAGVCRLVAVGVP